MKIDLFPWAAVSLGTIAILFFVNKFEKAQIKAFETNLAIQESCQKEVRALEDALIFMKKYAPEIDFLIRKGWLVPQNRLIASDVLEKLGNSLNKVHYTFEPETTKDIDEKYRFKVTKIVLKGGALLDTDIYKFIQNLLISFPGILVPQHITLVRENEISDCKSLKLTKNPTLISGTLIFEWVAMGENNDEP